jgi:FAD-NAD(P)-binding
MTSKDSGICVIGVGPRGLSVLERLCANAIELITGSQGLVIHLVDPYLGAGGKVWRTGQSAELLMNTVASQITMFVDGSVDCAGPLVPGPSLHEWAQFNVLMGPLDNVPGRILAEARRLGPDSYPTRAFYGQYLSWVLDHLISAPRPNVTITLHAQQAVDLAEDDRGRQVVTLQDGSRLADLDAVVLAPGHTASELSSAETLMRAGATQRGLVYVPPGNPADIDLDHISPGQLTVLRGMGLTFFDYLAMFTTGRGGRFRRTTGGRLRYHPSGREPRMLAGSRRGVPYHARAGNQKGAFGRHMPLFLTAEVIAGLRGRADADEPADFRSDVWPLVNREVRAVYYSTLIASRVCRCAADDFLRDYVTMHPGRPAAPPPGPLAPDADAAEQVLLRRFGLTGADAWNWSRIAYPYEDRTFRDQADFRRWLLSYLAADVREANRGNVGSPLKAALDVLRDLRNEIRLVVDHGGLSGDSYRDDLQGWYTPLNAFLSIGPPAQRIEEMAALIEQGLLDVIGPGITVELSAGRYLISSPRVPGPAAVATALIEARIPEADLQLSTDPLIRALLARGDGCFHHIPIRGGGRYETGGLAVSRRPYHLLDSRRRPHERRFAFGIPTETVHWVTAAGIRPGVNSVILGDADAIARSCLLMTAQAQARPRVGFPVPHA